MNNYRNVEIEAGLARLLGEQQSRLERRIADLDEAENRMESANREVAALVVERDRLNKAIETCEAANAFLNANLEAANRGNAAIAAALRARIAEVERLTAELSEEALHRRHAQATVAGLSVERDTALAAADEAIGKFNAGLIVNKRQGVEIGRLNGEIVDLNAGRDEARSACSAMDQAFLDMRAERDNALDLILGADAARDEAREQRDDSAALVDKLRAELHEERAEAERVVAELRAKLNSMVDEGCRLNATNLDLRGLAARAYIGADSRTMKRREIADMLAPLFVDKGPILKPWRQDPTPIHPDEIVENVEPAPLPPGYIEVDLATIPDDLAARIRADAPEGAAFVEVDASLLPDSVFRRIFALAPGGTEPVQVAEQAVASELEGVE